MVVEPFCYHATVAVFPELLALSEFGNGVVLGEYVLVGNGGKKLKVIVCDCAIWVGI